MSLVFSLFGLLFLTLLSSFVVGFVHDPWSRSSRVQLAEFGVICCIVALLSLCVYDVVSHQQTVMAVQR